MSPVVQVAGSLEVAERRMVPKPSLSLIVKRVLVPSLKAKLPVFVIFKVEFVSERDRLPPTVNPPEKVDAVLVVAPLPVTVAKVSASEVTAVEGMVISCPDLEREMAP